MRYIDADEIIEDLKTEKSNLYFNGLKGTPRPRTISFQDVIERINDTPTADVKPIVRGEYILVRKDDNDMPIYKCSICGTKRYGRQYFCFHCGADLSGRGDK